MIEKNMGPHMPLYLDRFLGGTMHFSGEEIGAYILMIAHQWQYGHVEDDQSMIERVARAEYGKLRRVLAKFKKVDGHLVNPVCDRVRRDREDWIKAQSERGKKGMASRWGSKDNERYNERYNEGYNQRNNHTDTDTDTNYQIPKTTTTIPQTPKPENEVVVVFEFLKDSTKAEIVAGLSGCRPDYAKLPEARWHEAIKKHNPSHEVVVEAANVFLKADANNIHALKAPAAYFAGIIKKLMEDRGMLRESIADKAARMRRSA